MNLYERSIEIILNAQNASGAYLACPNFPTYRYCWFRDGAFTAYAMDLAGQHASARRFHDWAADVIIERADVVQGAIQKINRGEALAGEDILHTRYSADGSASPEDWPNNQWDGFGTWLWALEEHQRLGGEAPGPRHLDAARLAADYLAAVWSLPCSDLWEEHPDQVHTYTLAAVYAGLQSATRMGVGDWLQEAAAVCSLILENCVSEGRFTKSVGNPQVDASLVALAVPYGVIALDDMRIASTIQQIKDQLCKGGGAHRYATDTYYGGGQWLLLGAWLGWYEATAGREAAACRWLEWVTAQADEHGWLPEQTPAALIDPAYYPEWRQRWGEIASPLLWSHAKYIILANALQSK